MMRMCRRWCRSETWTTGFTQRCSAERRRPGSACQSCCDAKPRALPLGRAWTHGWNESAAGRQWISAARTSTTSSTSGEAPGPMLIVDAGALYEVLARRRRGPAIRQRLRQDLHGRGHRHIGVRHIGRCSAGAGGTGGGAEPRAPQGTRGLRWLRGSEVIGPAPFRVARAGHGSNQGGPCMFIQEWPSPGCCWRVGSPQPAQPRCTCKCAPVSQARWKRLARARPSTATRIWNGRAAASCRKKRLALAAVWPPAARSCRSFASSA